MRRVFQQLDRDFGAARLVSGREGAPTSCPRAEKKTRNTRSPRRQPAQPIIYMPTEFGAIANWVPGAAAELWWVFALIAYVVHHWLVENPPTRNKRARSFLIPLFNLIIPRGSIDFRL